MNLLRTSSLAMLLALAGCSNPSPDPVAHEVSNAPADAFLASVACSFIDRAVVLRSVTLARKRSPLAARSRTGIPRWRQAMARPRPPQRQVPVQARGQVR